MTEPKKGSGEHPAMVQANKMLERIESTGLPAFKERVSRLIESTDRTIPPTPRPPAPSVPYLTTEWEIVIRGSGHHHTDSDDDAERAASRFVAALRASGHAVVSATFQSEQGREDVAPTEKKPDEIEQDNRNR